MNTITTFMTNSNNQGYLYLHKKQGNFLKIIIKYKDKQILQIN